MAGGGWGLGKEITNVCDVKIHTLIHTLTHTHTHINSKWGREVEKVTRGEERGGIRMAGGRGKMQ